MATRDEVAVGDTLELGQPGAAPSPFTVVGVIAYTLPARSPDGAIIVSLPDAQAHFGVTTAGLWAMVPARGVSPAAFRQAVGDTAQQLAAEPIDAIQLAGELARSFDRLIGLFDVLALIAVAVSAAGIVNALSVGVVERAREIAILRAHGMTVGQVQAMVVSEAAILGAIGGVLATGTGLAVAWAMIVAGAPRDFAAGLSVPWPLLIATFLLGIGVAAVAGRYPARRPARPPIVARRKHIEKEHPTPMAPPTRFWQTTPGRTFVGRLATGSDLVEEIERICAEQGILAAHVTVVGAATRAAFAYYDQEKQAYDELHSVAHHEIAGLIGNISLRDGKPFLHAHCSFGDASGGAVTGHLVRGTVVFVAEVTITEWTDISLVRTHDEATGLALW
jgi:predicted DNA-binding protein with PD1-like motif